MLSLVTLRVTPPTTNNPYGFAVPYSRGSQATRDEGPFGERKEADEERKGANSNGETNGETNTTKTVCFEASTIFNEPRVPHTLSPPRTSPGNRTHTYAVNALEDHDFQTEYWNSQDEFFEDHDPYASDSDQTAIEDASNNDFHSEDDGQYHDGSQASNSESDFHKGD